MRDRIGLNQVVFSDPYMECDMNRWTSPELDEAAAELRTDVALRLTASRLKEKFMTSCEVVVRVCACSLQLCHTADVLTRGYPTLLGSVALLPLHHRFNASWCVFTREYVNAYGRWDCSCRPEPLANLCFHHCSHPLNVNAHVYVFRDRIGWDMDWAEPVVWWENGT